MKGAIHQVNFFPWLGYFNKIAKSDIFILLDDVQGNRQTYSNRVQLLVNNNAHWLTAPVQKKARETLDFVFLDNNWREKRIKKTISFNYSKTPFFSKHKDFIFDLVDFPENSITKFNLNAIKNICSLLGYDTKKMVLSSDLKVDATSTERLVRLLMEVKCDTYIQGGGGSESYQDDSLFSLHNIALEKQKFKHPTYPQHNNKGEFVPGLSILDSLFNCGVTKTKALVEGS